MSLNVLLFGVTLLRACIFTRARKSFAMMGFPSDQFAFGSMVQSNVRPSALTFHDPSHGLTSAVFGSIVTSES